MEPKTPCYNLRPPTVTQAYIIDDSGDQESFYHVHHATQAGRVVSGTNKTAKKRTRGKSLARASLEHQNPLLASNPELGQNTARIDSGNQEPIRHRTHNKCEFGRPKTLHLLIAAGNWGETNISAGTRGPNSKIYSLKRTHSSNRTGAVPDVRLIPESKSSNSRE